jgi:hypothetical protein
MLDAVTGNVTSATFNRRSDRNITGIFKYKKTGSGTLTCTIYDGESGSEITSFTVGVGDPAAENYWQYLTQSFYAVVTNASGSFAFTLWVERSEIE